MREGKKVAHSPIPRSIIADLDREIEDAVGRIMTGRPAPGDYGLISDLSARRVELTEPEGFERITKLLEAAAALHANPLRHPNLLPSPPNTWTYRSRR